MIGAINPPAQFKLHRARIAAPLQVSTEAFCADIGLRFNEERGIERIGNCDEAIGDFGIGADLKIVLRPAKPQRRLCRHGIGIGKGRAGLRWRGGGLAQRLIVHQVPHRNMAKPQSQCDIIGNLAAKAPLDEIGVEIDHVERKRRVARWIGFTAAIFDKQLARACAVSGMDAIEVAFEQRADRAPAGEAVIIALFAAGDEAHPPSVACQRGQTAEGITIINAAILARHAHLRREAGAVGELRLHQFGIDRAAQRWAFSDRSDPAGNINAVDQNRRCVMQRRIHRIGAARGKALSVDAAQHALSGQPAIG